MTTIRRNNQKRRKIKHMQSKRLLIGIAGRARCGKDTVAEYLSGRYGFSRVAFADPMKDIVLDMFGWDDRHRDGVLKEEIDPYWGFSPRQAYQKFGTEFGRALNENMWILMMQHNLKRSHNWRTVVSDVRMVNEANWIRRNGILIHIFRQGTIKVNEHSSETPLEVLPSDLAISNNGTLRDLRDAVEAVLKPYIEEEGKPWR